MPDIDLLADELNSARLERRTVPTITSRVAGFSAPDAYAVQAAGIALRTAAGESIVGGKLGFTSVAMRRAMGVESPNYGWLTDTMLVHDRTIRLDHLIHPKVEPEIAFMLDQDLGAGAGIADVLSATAGVVACLEVVDSRYDAFRFEALDNIADDSSAGEMILGDGVRSPGNVDLRRCGVVLRVDGQVTMTAAGAAALDHPAAAVAWMANAVAHTSRTLQAGDIVLSGGLTAPVDLVTGMTVSVEIDHIGSASFRVTEE